ncbi:integration host factor subunit alpha [Candidatus Comchoanobacter bicostacola]|uniref:Integration host factor subunit alpha n=1 Tax=Candidatus Comchoanobacter bicostacola TaxID=2919598 RepID=A0ABY5DH82_9GAMM|nr:integration host factor subunit alpha [Candidatus Comchoanobacter bicostacola]UTC24108.1 integration host factor subunit alpha [Candidatus Comchoanobacter bicostacola]
MSATKKSDLSNSSLKEIDVQNDLESELKAKTLTRAILTEKLSAQMGMTRMESERFIDNLLNLMTSSLARGEEVKISSFGNFKLIDKEERPGRNPKTLEECLVDARRVVTFKAGNKLKSMIQEVLSEREAEES